MQPLHRKRARVVPPGFGSRASDVIVTPRPGEPGSDIKVRKPLTGMTIRLTPELLARLLRPGTKPSIELSLKSIDEGGPVLTVDGVRHETHAHPMAVGSEVHMLARTELREQQRPSSDEEEGEAPVAAAPNQMRVLSMMASLHQKLIVQQVLTAAKRAEIRARTEDSARQIQEAKRTNMVVIEDRDEMLAAAEAIPVPARQAPPAATAGAGQEARINGDQRNDRRRSWQQAADGGDAGAAAAEAEDTRGDGSGSPLTAWIYDCYNHDDYPGHVSDIRKFLSGIDIHQVMFRYHVKRNGSLDPDRRRFCVKFKTKAGCDLAVARSGEALGASGSWSPESVQVVRGRMDTAEDVPGGFLLVLPQGSSVSDVLNKVRARLPANLKPALMRRSLLSRSEADDPRMLGRSHERGNGVAGGEEHPPTAPAAKARRRRANRDLMEAYRRDMRRATLGATIAAASKLGPEWGSPEGRTLGTAEDNARRVATLAAGEAHRALLGRTEAEENPVGQQESSRGGAADGGPRGVSLDLPSGPPGGARNQRCLPGTPT